MYTLVLLQQRPMRLSKTAIFLLSCGCVLASIVPVAILAQEATFSQKLYGSWYTYPAGNPNTDPVRHEFRHNSATGNDELVVSRACPDDYRAVTATAVAPIQVSEDTIRVLKSASAVQPLQGTSVCQASVQAGTLSYSFSEDGNRLTITNPGGNPDILELARQDVASKADSPQDLYGTWVLPPLNTKEMQVQTRFVFYSTAERHEKLRQIAVCSKGNDSVVSQVDSEISIGKDQITILETASHDQLYGSFACTSSIAAGTWRYSMGPGGVTMTVSIDGSKPIKLTREAAADLN